MKLKLIDLGKDGSKWKHDYIPLNAAAVALKAHRKPSSVGAATPGAVKHHGNPSYNGPSREEARAATMAKANQSFKAGDRVKTEFGHGKVHEATGRSTTIHLDSGEKINVQKGTPGHGRRSRWRLGSPCAAARRGERV